MKALLGIVLFLLCGSSQIVAQELKVLANTKDSLELAYQKHALTGDFHRAAQAIAAYNDISFRWHTLHDSLKIEETKAKYQWDVREAEIALQEAQNANQMRKIAFALGIGLLLLLTMGLVRKGIRSKTQKEAERFQEMQIREQAEAQLRQEQLQRWELEKAGIRQKIDLKNRHLSSQMLQLLHKKQVLLQINQKANKLQEQPALISEILAEIQEMINPREDWTAFLQHVESVYPGFFPQLRAHAPQLTENDFKLCTLLRLQLSSKEMASMLSLSPDSVKTARYRLSQKLGLEKGQKINDFLMALG